MLLGGDAIRDITRGVDVTAAAHTAIRIEGHEKVRVTDGEKKRVRSARTNSERR